MKGPFPVMAGGTLMSLLEKPGGMGAEADGATAGVEATEGTTTALGPGGDGTGAGVWDGATGARDLCSSHPVASVASAPLSAIQSARRGSALDEIRIVQVAARYPGAGLDATGRQLRKGR